MIVSHVKDVLTRRKKHTVDEIVARLRRVTVLFSQTLKVAEVLRSIEVMGSRIIAGDPSTAG